MADITLPFLLSFTDSVRTEFTTFLDTAPSAYKPIAMEVNSTTAENVYPRLDQLPGLREWVGSRVVHGVTGGAFAIRNRTFEETLEVKRDDFDDDQYSLYTPVIQEMGQRAGELPDVLTFGLLKSGATMNCYDGTPYFGGGHMGYDASGNPAGYSNLQVPATGTPGPPWYLFDNTRAIKPMIVQRRRPFQLTARMNLSDPSVFDNGSFLWGVDGRMNVGFGLYQLAFMSTAPLTAANFAAARTAMMAQRRIDGVPFGVQPKILMHPPALAADARVLLNSELVPVTGGGMQSNPWKGAATPVEVEWLA